MRLSEITRSQLDHWRKARLDAGREKYGDAHLERYGLVDIAEELLDAQNIVELIQDRLLSEEGWLWGESWAGDAFTLLAQAFGGIELVLRYLQGIDDFLPASYRNDSKGGERVWWSEARRGAQDEDRG